jgi:hypothetical protein
LFFLVSMFSMLPLVVKQTMKSFDLDHEIKRGTDCAPVNISVKPESVLGDYPKGNDEFPSVSCLFDQRLVLGILTSTNELIALDETTGKRMLALVEARKAA